MRSGAESHTAAQPQASERRKYPRKKALLPAKLATEGGVFECFVLDLSRGGAKVEIKDEIAQGQVVTLILDPLGTFNGIVAWQRGGYLGVQFGELRPGAPAPEAAVSHDPPARTKRPILESDAAPVARDPGPPPGAPAFPSEAEISETLLVSKRRATPERRGPRDILKLVREEQNVFTLKAGEVLFKAGDPAGRMYIVRSGRLSIESITGTSESIGSGGIVGESGLVEHDVARGNTAVAVTDCELVEIDGRRFFSLIDEQPGFAVAVMQVLSRRLRHLEGPVDQGPVSAAPRVDDIPPTPERPGFQG
jgi:CRP/FNR family transcriptional regulator, cyclic AMP receptor protein